MRSLRFRGSLMTRSLRFVMDNVGFVRVGSYLRESLITTTAFRHTAG